MQSTESTIDSKPVARGPAMLGRHWDAFGSRVLLGLILLVGLGFRLYDIKRAPWIDEILTHDGAIESVRSALTQKFYPLSYLLVNASLRIADNDLMLRMPSLLAGLAGIWLVYMAATAAYSRTAGLLAAALLAVSSAHIVYSQEARYYSMLAAASVFSLWMLWRALGTGAARFWIGFASAVACGALTQGLYYLFLASIVLPAVVWLAVARPAETNVIRRRQLLSLQLSLFAGLIPAGIAYLIYQTANTGIQTIVANDAGADLPTFKLSLQEYCFDLYELINCFKPRVNQLFVWSAGLGVVVLWRRGRRGAAITCVGAFIFCPLPLFFVTVHHWYASKYFIAQLPLFFIVAAVGMAAAAEFISRHVSKFVPPVLFLILFAVIIKSPELYEYRSYPGRMRFKIREWQDVAPPIIERMTSNDLILHMARFRRTAGFGKKGTPIEWYELQRYLERSTPPGRLPIHPTEYTGTSSTEEMRTIIEGNPMRTIWVVADRFAYFEYEPAVAQMLKTEVSTFRHQVYSIGEPTQNLVEQPQATDEGETTHTYRITCTGGTTVSLALRDVDSTGTGDMASTMRAHLTPDQPYTLSAYIKYKNIRPDPDKNAAGEPVMNEQTSGFVGISGTSADGSKFFKKLMLFDGTSDWRQVAIKVLPHEHPEMIGAKQLSVDFGVGDKKGSLRIDKVQLEAKDHPTPFTPDYRLPHDQALRLFDKK